MALETEASGLKDNDMLVVYVSITLMQFVLIPGSDQ